MTSAAPFLNIAAYKFITIEDPAGMRAAYETGAGRHRATVLAALVVLLPLGLEMGRTSGSLWVGFSLPIDWGLISGPEQRAALEACALARVTMRAMKPQYVGTTGRERVV